MRLLSLELQNFQAHTKTTIKFDPKVTTLKGPTDAGKSAILRALRWLCLNDLAGDEFVREGEKKAQVTLVVGSALSKPTECFEITRTKSIASTGINTYHLDEAEYKSFATSVPTDIAKLLNLNEINFQAQHDSPFWFTETAGEVSRKLNAVIDLSIIDSALSYVAAQVRLAQERNTVSEERLEGLKKELADLEPQRNRVHEFQKIKDKYDALEQLKEDRRNLDDLITRISERESCAERLEGKSTEGSEVLKFALDARRLQKQRDNLNYILEQIDKHQSAAKSPPDFRPVDEAWTRWSETLDQREALRILIQNIEDQEEVVEELRVATHNHEKTFQEKTKNQLCPTCQRPL